MPLTTNKKPEKIKSISRGADVVNGSPKVSIVIPNHNSSNLISETLDSVFAQTFTDFEVILVDDGSTDIAQLQTALKPYADKLVFIVQENSGTASARNAAIGIARGEWIAFLDSDDIWFANYLTEQLAAAEEKNCDLIYCDAIQFGSIEKETNYSRKAPSSGMVTSQSLISATCNVITSGTIARRLRIIECGCFDEDLPRIGFEDFDLWFRMTKAGIKLDYHTKVLLKYRVRSESLSGDRVKIAERNIIAREILGNKYELDDAERKALERHVSVSKAELNVEHAKKFIAADDFTAAISCLKEANKVYKKVKLSTVILLLRMNPIAAKKLFGLIQVEKNGTKQTPR